MLDLGTLLAHYAPRDRATAWLRANFVASLDGAATIDGRSGGLGDAEDQHLLGTLRMLADVLLVGAGTVRSEAYGALRLDEAAVAWRREQGLPDHPVLAIVSGSLHLNPDDEVFADAPIRPLVLTHAGAPEAARAALAGVADVVDCGDDAVAPALLRRQLQARGLRQILCEGGPTLFGSLAVADQVDELCLTVAPVLVAGSAARIAVSPQAHPHQLRLQHALAGERMLFLRYTRPSNHPAARR